MIDVNYELRISYFSLIAGNIFINGQAIPLYYGQAPLSLASNNPDNYILINTIYSNNFNDDKFNYTNTTVQLMIVTKKLQNNSGAIADSIANQIYGIIYPYPRAQIVQITSGYVADTKMFLDTIQSGLNDGEKKVVNRVISFLHIIRHFLGGGGITGNIFYGVQSTNGDPIDFTNALGQDCGLPISVDYGSQLLPIFFWLAVPSGCGIKGNWDDLNGDNNGGTIGGLTDLYEIRPNFVINAISYNLYMTRYKTGFNGFTAQIKYY